MKKTRITPGQVEVVKDRLARGMKQQEIADELGISRSTVARIKKALAGPGSKDKADDDKTRIDAILSDYHIRDKSKYQDFSLERVKREAALFEDPEEGWVYKSTRKGQENKETSHWWIGIAYPESAPDKMDWIRALERKGFAVAVSPLHDKDVWNHDSPEVVDEDTGEIIREKGKLYKVGDRKKAHYHFIITTEKNYSWSEINRVVQGITHGPMIQKCRSLKNAFEYFLHKNHPDRYQGYDADEIYTSHDWHLEPSAYEKKLIFQDVVTYIVDHEIDSRKDLVKQYEKEPEYLAMLKSGSFISGLITENWTKHHPEGRTKNINVVNVADLERIIEKWQNRQ
jgi:transcriptional regulator with XRE-family HTH domain